MTVSVYVGNLASTTEEDQIRSAFKGAGIAVQNVLVMRSSRDDRSRGFGFVDLETLEEAEAAIRTMEGAAIDGRPLTLGLARERAPASTGGRSFQSYGGPGGGEGSRRPGGGSRKRRTR